MPSASSMRKAACWRGAPPFRPITPEEDAESVERINTSGAGLVFVGLGCPKQEHWMLAHRGRINAVMLGVGAAFDFHAGTVSRAPQWMRDNGLDDGVFAVRYGSGGFGAVPRQVGVGY